MQGHFILGRNLTHTCTASVVDNASFEGPDSFCRDLHKEVVAGIDEAMARHAQETDKVDLLTLKKLKGRVNILEQQIVTDKAKQLTVSHSPAPPCIALNLCCCYMANG